MAYGTPADPVGGTIITVAYAVSNLLDPIRWLRLLTGNSDPPGSNYVVVSTSTTGTSWQKIPADALATGAAVASLGFTPLRNTTDTLTGNLTVTSSVSAVGIAAGASGLASDAGVTAVGQISGGSYAGGSTSTGTPSVKGLNVGTDGIASTGPVSPASYAGGSTSVGTPSVLGLVVGASGIAVGAAGVNSSGPVAGTTGTFSGAVSGASYTGGSTGAGAPSVLGLNVGASGIAVAGQIASSVTTGTAPFTVASTTLVSNLNADLLDGLSSAAFSRIASGTYTGNGASSARQITTGFVAKCVLIYNNNGAGVDTMFVMVSTAAAMQLGTGPLVQGTSAVHLHASDGFTVADGTTNGNVNTLTYTYTAFG